MAKISGDYGSQQTTNGVVELLSPLGMVWRRAAEWSGATALGSDGTSITFTNTNLPREGHCVQVDSTGKVGAVTALSDTDSGADVLLVVWTGYDQHDTGAIDTITVIDGAYFLFELSSDRVSSSAAPSAGAYAYYDAGANEWTNATGSGTTHYHRVGVCENTVTRNSATYYRIRWQRFGAWTVD